MYNNLLNNSNSSPTLEYNPYMQYILKLWLPFKNWAFGKILLFAAFLSPIQPLIICATLFAILDYFVKLYCVYKVEGKQGIKSNKMQDTFYKILLYAGVISVLFIVDQLFVKTLFLDLFNHVFAVILDDPSIITGWLTKVQFATVGTFMILLREGKSLDENWEVAFGVSPLDEINKIIKPFLIWKK